MKTLNTLYWGCFTSYYIIMSLEYSPLLCLMLPISTFTQAFYSFYLPFPSIITLTSLLLSLSSPLPPFIHPSRSLSPSLIPSLLSSLLPSLTPSLLPSLPLPSSLPPCILYLCSALLYSTLLYSSLFSNNFLSAVSVSEENSRALWVLCVGHESGTLREREKHRERGNATCFFSTIFIVI